MSNNLTTFLFRTNAVRVVEIGGAPWFVSSDVCRCLGLSIGNGVFAHLQKLRQDEKQPVPPNVLRGKGGHNVTLISESGLYKLVLRSDKQAARAFQDWVTGEVLPSIRKTGAYSTAPAAPEAQPEAVLKQLFSHVDQDTLNTFARLLVATVDAARGAAPIIPPADATPAKRREIKAEDLKPFLTARMVVVQRWPEARSLTAPEVGQRLAELSMKGGYATEKTGPYKVNTYCLAAVRDCFGDEA